MKIPADIPRSKRIFDIAITIPILILFSPILLLVALIVGIVHGRPLLFSQVRPGYRGELFTMYKFRTMRDLYDENGNLLPDEERLTRVGKYLRASSLDELPEFFTVLRGKMSLVGPRPLLAEYLGRYSTEQARRHDVLPGITGWAQIHGRNVLTWEDKFLLDVWYVDHWSIGLDIKILFQTFWKVIKREGICQPGFATAEFFMGNVNNGDSKYE